MTARRQFIQKNISGFLSGMLLSFLLLLTIAPHSASAFYFNTPEDQSVPFAGVQIIKLEHPLFCAPHVIIYDYGTKNFLAIAIQPELTSYELEDKSATFLAGAYINQALPCVLPYPVYQIDARATAS